MTRAELLELEQLSHTDLTTLRSSNETLFKALEPRMASARQSTVLAQFAGASSDLRARLSKAAFALAPDQSLETAIAAAVSGTNVTAGLVAEAAAQLAELRQAGALTDPVDMKVPLAEHPLFQDEVQKGRVLRMAQDLRLDDAKADALVKAIGSPSAVTDDALDAAVKGGTLTEADAERLGLTASLYALSDDEPQLAEAIRKVGKVKAVGDLARLDAAVFRKAIDSARVTVPEGDTPDAWAERLAATTAQLFPGDALAARATPAKVSLDSAPQIARLNPGLGIEAVLASQASDEEKLKTVTTRVQLGTRLRELNPDRDFLALDYTPESEDLRALKMPDADEPDLRAVVDNLKAQQRAFALTGDVEHTAKLLAAGYHSSQQLATIDVETLATAGKFDVTTARRIKHTAENRLAAVTNVSGAMLDLVRNFGLLGVGNVMPTVNDYLRKIPGYEDLFGSQAYCKCEHCQSILGPAAYFVDLMKFIELNVLKKVFTGPLASHVLHLKSRRPDLWTLPLTCENTNTLVPYLDIINEVLENYIARRRGYNGDLANRRAVSQVVYEQAIAELVHSFRQPFVLPVARIDEYLRLAGSSRAHVARALGAAPAAVSSGVLRLSAPDRTIIAQPNTAIAFLRDVYGVNFTQSGAQVQPVNAQDLLRFTGLSRDELGALTASTFVSPTPATAVTIRAEKTSADSVQNDIERVHGLTRENLDRLHRMARLWRRLGWTIPEVDLALERLAAAGLSTTIDTSALDHLATLAGWRERWGVALDELTALVGEVPTRPLVSGRKGLFDRLFNLPPFVQRDGALPMPAVSFVHPAFRTTGVSVPDDNTMHRLMAGLRLSNDALARLITHLAAPLGATLDAPQEDDRGFLLTSANLSLLYRHARMASILRLSVDQLFQAITLAAVPGGHLAGLDEVVQFTAFHDWWRDSGFTLDQLGVITRGPVLNPSIAPVPADLAAAVVASVASDRALEFADLVFAFVGGVTEEQSRALVQANLARLETHGTGYRLASTFDPTTPLTVPAGITVAESTLRAALMQYHAGTAIVARLASRLSVSIAQAQALVAMTGVDLTQAAMVDAAKGGAIAPLETLVDQLVPLVALFKNRVFDAEALDWIRQQGAMLSIPDFGALTLDAVRATVVYAHAVDAGLRRAETAGTPFDPTDVRTALSGFVAATGFDTVDQSVLARAVGVDEAQLAVMRPNLTLPGTATAALAVLRSALAVAETLGVGGDTLSRILSSSYDELAKAADALLSASRARFASEEEWERTLEPHEDRLRSARRDALVDHLIRSVHPEFETTSDLYHHFLLDVQLEGCARTSRLVAAISSAQVYVQRCLMNLERNRRAPTDPQYVHVEPTLIPADEWEWRKNYRVWEANRKVFLFPENYIEPELRDDKTPLFTELESTLLQQEISEQNSLDAYARYLAGFEEVGRLRIAGAYHHRPAGAEEDILHLIGVTSVDPPVFYHRVIENAYHGEAGGSRGIVWGPWRKIDVSIPVRKVSPVVFLDRLFLFWVDITTQSKNTVKDGGSVFTGYQHKLQARYVMQRLDGAWTQPQEVTLAGSVFPKGNGIVNDPLASTEEQEAFADAFRRFSVSDMATALQQMSIPQFDTVMHPEPLDDYTLKGFAWDTLYPHPTTTSLRLSGRNFAMRGNVDFYTRRLGMLAKLNLHAPASPRVVCARVVGSNMTLFTAQTPTFLLDDFAHATLVADSRRLDAVDRTKEMGPWMPMFRLGLYQQQIASGLRATDDIVIVNGLTEDAILDCSGDTLLLQGSVRPGAKYLIKRLGTTLGETMARTLFVGGVDLLLDTRTQLQLGERTLPLALTSTIENGGNAGRLDFTGSMGTYFREVFFHIPFLVANHLNSQQQFAEAQRWYHYIFNPTAHEPLPSRTLPAEWRERLERNRVWRYREFRNLDVPKLRDVLTDPAAIEVYKQDPFNPHAIARLRLSAYQKTIVMKYVDNLLDWADALFARFTMESVQEATMLYVMALDVLGPRPAALGQCGEAAVTPRTYETIGPLIDADSEFLVEMENWIFAGTGAVKSPTKKLKAAVKVVDRATKRFAERTANVRATTAVRSLVRDVTPAPSVAASAVRGAVTVAATGLAIDAVEANVPEAVYVPSIPAMLERRVVDAPAGLPGNAATLLPEVSTSDIALRATDTPVAGHTWKATRIAGWQLGPSDRVKPGYTVASPVLAGIHRVPGFAIAIARQLKPVFCIPMNKDLLALWDRVEDRLYKIRHCLDINGVRRDLALFAPEIDPRMLVRARAAGLSIDDVLGASSGNLPPYRFTFLIERAKAHTAAVQGFGAALTSALEKRDAEELNRLRLTQQQNLLRLSTRVREWEITSAADGVAQIEKQIGAVTYRRDYYRGLADTGLSPWERTQQVSRHTSSILSGVAAGQQIVAGIGYLIPQLGSPFAMKYGGVELGNSAQAFAHVTKNLVAVAEAISASAGLEAGFERRFEGWEHQAELAERELKVLDSQLSAARLRKEISVKALEIHQQSMEQAEEIFQFHQERFSNLGLYTWLSTTLQRAYREAYNSAFALARLAEQAYRFERSDEATPLLSYDYWDGQKAGLLAGERLSSDLLNLERRFYETNYRPLEIDQPFSLGQMNPAALVQLRESGTCEFDIPEVFFDLFYPGQYRRRIRSVRLTIPCVTGPYTNVAATLTLTGSRMRMEANLAPAALVDLPPRRSVSISTSTAQSDAGVFEFSFRDERYLPFEGAGAVSSWRLSLPAAFRAFDYQTINDVIVHVSYSAEEDGVFRAAVEQQNGAIQGTILNYLSTNPVARVLSLRQDFSGALTRLVHSAAATPVRIDIGDKHFPIVLRGRPLQVTTATLLLRTPPAQTVSGTALALNGTAVSGFTRRPALGNLWGADVTAQFAAGPAGAYTIEVSAAGDLAPETPVPGDPSVAAEDKLNDMLLYLEYQVA